MKKYGIGTGISAIIFGVITLFSFYVFISFLTRNVEDLPELIVIIGFGFAMLVISLIVGIISGGITLLFAILTIVRIAKAVKQSKVDRQHSAITEPKL